MHSDRCPPFTDGRRCAKPVLGVALAALFFVVGCGSDNGETTGHPYDTPAPAVDDDNSGQGANTPAEPATGHPSSGFVSAGQVSKSAKYKLVFALGQSTLHQADGQSAQFEYHGGLIRTAESQ